MSIDRISFQGSELLPERIAGTLRQAIVDGVLAPGARLLEQDLSRRMGVSRVPLREAFRVLAGEGLVSIQPHRGALVAGHSDEELRELFAVRAMFESQAARLLAQRKDGATPEALGRMVEGMKAAVRAGNTGEYVSLAARFHDTLVGECGNALLARFYGQIRTHLRRYQKAMVALPELPAKSIREHEAILAAIRAGKGEAAARLAGQHIDELVQRYEHAAAARARPAATRGTARNSEQPAKRKKA